MSAFPPVLAFGAVGAVPAGNGVVEGEGFRKREETTSLP